MAHRALQAQGALIGTTMTVQSPFLRSQAVRRRSRFNNSQQFVTAANAPRPALEGVPKVLDEP